MPYTAIDGYGSVITVNSSVTAGSTQTPVVNVASILTPLNITLTGNPSISGTVNVGSTVAIGNSPSISGGTINLGSAPSIYGNISGSVVAFQGSNPWVISSIPGIVNIAGSVATTGNVNVSGSVVSFNGGTQRSSVFGMRNDAVASFLGADLTVRPIATDSAGRTLNKPFAPEEARIEGYASVVSTSVTTLVAAPGAGLRNYITDVVLANTGGTTTLVTFRSGGGTSVLGYGIAPAGGGSNMLNWATPMRTLANETFDFQATSSSSILFAKVSGFKAP